jgi:hypothetical protein
VFRVKLKLLMSPHLFQQLCTWRAVVAQSRYRPGYGLDNRGTVVRFPKGTVIFVFYIASRPAVVSTQPAVQCPFWDLFPRVNLSISLHLLPPVPSFCSAWSSTGMNLLAVSPLSFHLPVTTQIAAPSTAYFMPNLLKYKSYVLSDKR